MVTRLEAYRLLGVSPDATPEQLRSAFRRKVMEQHPDTAVEGGVVGSTVQELVDAYHLLVGSEGAGRTGPERLDQVPGYRIEVDHRPQPDQPPPARPCRNCRGSGIRRRVSTCLGCGGAGHVTILDAHRVRRSRCRRCGGRGRMGNVEICPTCGGAGI
jgi:DnaJ-class molecular chaperone